MQVLVARGWGKENGEQLLNGCMVSFQGEDNLCLKTRQGDLPNIT